MLRLSKFFLKKIFRRLKKNSAKVKQSFVIERGFSKTSTRSMLTKKIERERERDEIGNEF